jgi:peptide synthetase PhsA
MLHNIARHRPLNVASGDCMSLISADGFVASISNPYVALLNGAALAPYSFRDEGVERVMDWIERGRVTVLYAFPSFLRQIAAAEHAREHMDMRLVYLGGETVLASDLAAARRLFPAATLSIGLNSSETGLTCLHMIPANASLPDPVPAGSPVVDVEVTVVDESNAPTPPGETGEIAVRSEYVRPRYWPVDASSANGAPAHAFRTGDRGRIDTDGLVYHLGRVDAMVKVRGFRVELAEVETAIAGLDAVAEVAVVGVGDDPAALELAACVVGRNGTPDAMTVRQAVARALPAAMIPARVLMLETLPHTPNGKLDRKALARIAGSREACAERRGRRLTDGSAQAPLKATQLLRRDHVERHIARIWASVLGASVLGSSEVREDADFFLLGGTSIDAVSVIAQVQGELGVRVPLAVIFNTPTLSALTSAVIDAQGNGAVRREAHQAPDVIVRLAEQDDFSGVCRLVNHYIERSTFNFRTEPQATDEWIDEWSATQTRYPWLVAVAERRLVGVAYAIPWKHRSAYDWCAEVAAYVSPDARRTGVGRALYARLLDLLDRQGFRTEVAAIALPNEASVAFHEAHGFWFAGVLERVGFKHGRWLDVGFWQRSIRWEGEKAPVPTIGVQRAEGPDAWTGHASKIWGATHGER